MKIPKSFYLMGKLYTVKIIPAEEWESEEVVGLCNPQKLEISIKSGLKKDLMEHIFLHEVTHAILDVMGEDKLYKDEGFVDMFAGLIHQALLPTGRSKKRR